MSDIFYLFRYRDLLAPDTLAAHRKIISVRGACWWGWWQRPSEEVRVQLWETLRSEIGRCGTVEIGLFNSDPKKTSGLVHRATLTGVIQPSDGGPAPAVPSSERDLIPSYYRETPFSSAWMRLTEIKEAPIRTFFGQFCFARAPRIRGISEDRTERFIDKVVLDADELRTMDTTIWELRPRGPDDDRDERILTASAGLTAAVSGQPVLLKSERILHLSDLHFSKPLDPRREHRWQFINEGLSTLHKKILGALGEQPRVGLVIVSGDLTHTAEPDEFYEVFRFLHALLGALKLGPEQLMLVPGNHDIAWTRQGSESWNPEEPVVEAPVNATAAFRNHYQRVFRHPPSPTLSMARRYILPNGTVLEIAGLNSSGLEQGSKWLAGMGRVPDNAFAEVTKELGWTDRPSRSLRLLVHHHHLTATEDVLPTSEFAKGFGMAADAKQTLRAAARYGVQLALHGHRHQPFLGAEEVYAPLEDPPSSRSLGRVGIVGGGSAGSTSVDHDSNYFNLFEVHPERIEFQLYRAKSEEGKRGDFAHKQTWNAPLTEKQGRLVIGQWKHVSPSGAGSSGTQSRSPLP